MKRLDRFILSYNGNKYMETKKYLSQYFDKIKQYKIIAEPFCGIFGFSRAFFEVNKDFEGEFWLNDKNEDLINVFKKLQDNPQQFINDIREEYNTCESDEDIKSKFKKNECSKGFTLIFRGLCERIFDKEKGFSKLRNFEEKLDEYIEFFKKVKFFNMDASDFIKQLNKEDTFIFFDPPYFNSSNTEYQSKDDGSVIYRDGTGLYLDVYNYMSGNGKCILIVNKIDILDFVLNKFKIGEIKGSYQNNITRKKDTKKKKNIKWHIIYGSV